MHSPIVIAGWGQITQHKQATPPYLDPVDMMEHAAREAGAMAGRNVLQDLDAILVVRTQSRVLQDPDHELARRLGAKPGITSVSGIGGQVPQQLVNQAAGMLARGEVRSVLIAGAETYYPRTADAVRGEAALVQGIPADYAADDAVGANDLEMRHGLSLPVHGFPLFENALWAASGLSKDAWLEKVGGMWAGFSEVAAGNPYAWTRSPVRVHDIITPNADNRPIAYPYTKRMVSLVMADLGAAVIMTTAEHAASTRDGAGKVVYFLGGGMARDRQRFLAEKASFTRSPALENAQAKAERRAGISAADIETFDLYSCFPCAVSVARRTLGLDDGDPRALTQTGGLGFFGGPGSNYALHGITNMAATLAAGQHRSGLTTALGWFMHKYAVGIYAAAPGTRDLRADDREDSEHPEAGDPPIAIDEAPNGEGRIETWTVIYNRAQAPVCGVIYGRTAAGERFVANSPDDDASYQALTGENVVGRTVALESNPDTRRTLAILND